METETKTDNRISWAEELKKISTFATRDISQWLDDVLERRYNFISQCWRRYVAADWGDLCDEDKQANDAALVNGARILAAYHLDGRKIYIITEARGDNGKRAYTTILFPEEY